MLKKIIAGIKTVLLLVGAIVGLIGVRYFMILTRQSTCKLDILIQIVILAGLCIGALALFCNQYLKEDK